MLREKRRLIGIPVIVLIVLIVIAVIFIPLPFLPIRRVDVSESRDVPYKTGIDVVNLEITVDVGRVNVGFEDLDGKLVSLQVSVTGYGSLILPKLYDLSFGYTFMENVLNVSSKVDTSPSRGWWGFSSMNFTCNLLIERSMNASLNVKTSVGGIVMSTRAGVVLNSLSLESTTGEIEANLMEDVVVASNVSVKTTTGGVKFSWHNVIVTKDVLVDLKTTTGGVDVDVTQDKELLRNIKLKTETTTGGVDFAIEIQGDIGARIEPSFTPGGVNIGSQVRFSNWLLVLQSDNYPARRNFDVSLKTTTGRINIDAKYAP